MAYCRAALILRLTLGLALCLAQCVFVSTSDDPASKDLRQDPRQSAGGLLLSEGARAAAATHGMTATPVTTAGASAVSAIGSAAAYLAVGSRRARGVGWLPSSGGSRRRGAERPNNWGRSSTKSVGAGVGQGRRALSLLTPAVAPRAGTSALFVVSAAGPAAASTRARETYLSEVDRARCRPLARSTPFRLKTELFVAPPAKSKAAGPGSSSVAADPGPESTSEMMCGGGEGGGSGGMTSSFTWLESVNSTMDEIKTLIVNQEGSSTNRVFAVAAREQVRGRGTKGRAWVGLPGNVFLTVAIPLDRVPVPLSLIPLRVGSLIAPEIQRRLLSSSRHCAEGGNTLPSSPSSLGGAEAKPAPEQQQQQQQQPRVSLKWPNDVLLGGSKVAGVLIEAELPFLLIGIGVNVRHKPEVPQQGPDRGRPAACLGDFGVDSSDEAVRELSAALTEKLCSWASGTDSASAALSEFSRWVDWSLPLEIRDEGRAVTAVGIAPDGRLRVVDPSSGKEELLSTEYLL
eukprot:g14668.t1